ncbi:saccharopine dehydrogenase family protein [Merdibacter massiliensis]|uniref:saccharopine dehydrogenase family protein n=1 Tax=Merdibacter massiliensis TaxID=1871030 RepID=UPI00192A656A|nr:saccharopine dehydrogenase C-terminal domain-containing protein [Merdibacter massiliensis]
MKMRMMVVGSGAVAHCIVKQLLKRDPKKEWFAYALLCDIDIRHAEKIQADCSDTRIACAKLDATDKQAMVDLMKEHQITFVLDAASPFCANYIFDAAFEAKADYANLGTWSVPKKVPAYGEGIENSYDEVMTAYHFDRHEQWKKQGNMALICLGIDPGVVNVFAKYLCAYEFDRVQELHVKDGGDLHALQSDPEDIVFGFNVWTVLDEVMNPNVEYIDGRYIVEKAFAGEEQFCMPEAGMNTLVKVEHEETVTMPRYLSQYGLKRCSFKIALDENLIQALKVLDKLHLNSIEPVQVKDTMVVPRDVIAACAPQPSEQTKMAGNMIVGVYAIGQKDGKEKKVMMYQKFSQEEAMQQFGLQAVVAQTGFGAAIAIELYARDIYHQAGVYSLEAFDPMPFLELMKETNFHFAVQTY